MHNNMFKTLENICKFYLVNCFGVVVKDYAIDIYNFLWDEFEIYICEAHDMVLKREFYLTVTPEELDIIREEYVYLRLLNSKDIPKGRKIIEKLWEEKFKLIKYCDETLLILRYLLPVESAKDRISTLLKLREEFRNKCIDISMNTNNNSFNWWKRDKYDLAVLKYLEYNKIRLL